MTVNKHTLYLNYIPSEELVKTGKIRMVIKKNSVVKPNDEITLVNGIYPDCLLRKVKVKKVEPIYIDKNGIWVDMDGHSSFNPWESVVVDYIAKNHGAGTGQKLRDHLLKLYGLTEKAKYVSIWW